MLDSVYRGYPIGSLLFWRSNQHLRSERNIGGFSLPETEEKYPTNYVLDGQQRLTTLYATLTRGLAALEPRFRIVFDLKDEAFVPAPDELESHHVSLHVLQDMRKYVELHKRLEGLPEADDLTRTAENLWETFHEYVIPVVTVSEAPINTVGIIFERINSTGTRLTIFDLMVAATWAIQDDEEFDLRSRVEAIRESLADKDFGDVEDVTVLRSMAAVGTRSARRDAILSLRDRSLDDLKLLIEESRSAIHRAVDFLATEVSVPSSDFLPYERQFVLLTYALSQQPRPTPDQMAFLRRWFWRTSFAERYRTGGEAFFDSDLDRAINAVQNGDPNTEPFGTLPNPSFYISSRFRKGAAASHAFAVLLGFQGPRNLTNGAAIDVGTALSTFNRKEFHHIFPQRYLRDEGVESDLINALANICLLSSSENKVIGSRPPSEYIPHIRAALGEHFEEVLASNLIPADCIPLLEADDYSGFLEQRSAHISATVMSLG